MIRSKIKTSQKAVRDAAVDGWEALFPVFLKVVDFLDTCTEILVLVAILIVCSPLALIGRIKRALKL